MYIDYEYKIRDEDLTDKDDESDYGIAYGAQAGIMFAFNEKVEVEAGYRYTWASNLDIEPVGEELEFDYYDNIYIAFNYNF